MSLAIFGRQDGELFLHVSNPGQLGVMAPLPMASRRGARHEWVNNLWSFGQEQLAFKDEEDEEKDEDEVAAREKDDDEGSDSFVKEW